MPGEHVANVPVVVAQSPFRDDVQRRPEVERELCRVDLLDEEDSALVAGEVFVELALMCDRGDRFPF
jgi:hypothetical protein